MRFDYQRHAEIFYVIDNKQGSTRSEEDHKLSPIAIVFDIRLAERMVENLNKDPRYYSTRD